MTSLYLSRSYVTYHICTDLFHTMDTQTDKENNTPATAHKQAHSSDTNGNDKMTCEKDNDTNYDEDDENDEQTQEKSMEDYMPSQVSVNSTVKYQQEQM